MTRTGSYLAMNRMGMHDCSSPFLQMSFETTATFLTKAAQEGASDAQQSPSARIVLGMIDRFYLTSLIYVIYVIYVMYVMYVAYLIYRTT